MPVVTVDNTITFALSVKDRHASADWYARMLGFKVLFHADDAGWSEMTTLTDGVTLGLGEMADAQPGNATPVFGTADVDAARQALEAEGVKFDGETVHIEGMVRLVTFFDPDDNALMLAQTL